MAEQHATYVTYEIGGTRIHQWGNDKFAMGYGPITYATREEVVAFVRRFIPGWEPL